MPQRAPRWKAVDRPSARKLNRIGSQIDTLFTLQDLNPSPLTTGGHGQLLPLEILSFDHVARTITCVPRGMFSDPNAVQYVVILPELFGQTTRNGATYVYPTDNINAREQTAPVTESQEITPNFILGEHVYAFDSGLGTDFEWFPDGRMWASV